MATSLLMLFDLDTSTVHLAKAGEGFPLFLLPRGATVLGSTDDGTGQPTTYALFASDYRGAVDSLRDRLLVSGWRPIEDLTPQTGGGRGVPLRGGRGSATLLPTYRCPTGDSLQSIWIRSFASNTLVTLQHFRSASGAPCISPIDLPLNVTGSISSEAAGIEFLNAVLRDRGLESGRVQLGVGDSAVGWIANAPRMTLFGSAAFSFGSVTAVASELEPDSVFGSIVERARSEGFEVQVTPKRVSRLDGFEDPRYEPEASATFCRAPFVVAVSVDRRMPTGSRVAIMHARPPEMPCRIARVQPVPQTVAAPAALLKPPANARHSLIARSKSTSNGTTIRFESNATVRNALSLGDLLRHYSAQLEAQGWTVSDPVRTSASVSRQFRLTHSDGAQWSGELRLTPQRPPSTLVNLAFSARR